jgi:hypothetical protein
MASGHDTRACVRLLLTSKAEAAGCEHARHGLGIGSWAWAIVVHRVIVGLTPGTQ